MGKQWGCKPQETSTQPNGRKLYYMLVNRYWWIIKYFKGEYWNLWWFHKKKLSSIGSNCHIVSQNILSQFTFDNIQTWYIFISKGNLFHRWMALDMNEPQNLALLTLGTLKFSLIGNLFVHDLLVCNIWCGSEKNYLL